MTKPAANQGNLNKNLDAFTQALNKLQHSQGNKSGNPVAQSPKSSNAPAKGRGAGFFKNFFKKIFNTLLIVCTLGIAKLFLKLKPNFLPNPFANKEQGSASNSGNNAQNGSEGVQQGSGGQGSGLKKLLETLNQNKNNNEEQNSEAQEEGGSQVASGYDGEPNSNESEDKNLTDDELYEKIGGLVSRMTELKSSCDDESLIAKLDAAIASFHEILNPTNEEGKEKVNTGEGKLGEEGKKVEIDRNKLSKMLETHRDQISKQKEDVTLSIKSKEVLAKAGAEAQTRKSSTAVDATNRTTGPVPVASR